MAMDGHSINDINTNRLWEITKPLGDRHEGVVVVVVVAGQESLPAVNNGGQHVPSIMMQLDGVNR